MRKYYLSDGQVKKGPFSLEEVKAQPLNKDTLVWYAGLGNWTVAENLDEFKGIFDSKITPPPLPKMFEKNIPSRNEILNSFTDATEIYPEGKKKNIFVPILILLAIAGILYTAFLYYQHRI